MPHLLGPLRSALFEICLIYCNFRFALAESTGRIFLITPYPIGCHLCRFPPHAMLCLFRNPNLAPVFGAPPCSISVIGRGASPSQWEIRACLAMEIGADSGVRITEILPA